MRTNTFLSHDVSVHQCAHCAGEEMTCKVFLSTSWCWLVLVGVVLCGLVWFGVVWAVVLLGCLCVAFLFVFFCLCLCLICVFVFVLFWVVCLFFFW